jgi:hypothetical protein
LVSFVQQKVELFYFSRFDKRLVENRERVCSPCFTKSGGHSETLEFPTGKFNVSPLLLHMYMQ